MRKVPSSKVMEGQTSTLTRVVATERMMPEKERKPSNLFEREREKEDEYVGCT